jgi:hypothetical protein
MSMATVAKGVQLRPLLMLGADSLQQEEKLLGSSF